MAQIGLLDCNNFFVSCERLFRPDLWKKPVAVLSSNDGCIVARSQEVKDMGIPMGAPYFQVKQQCEAGNVQLFSGNLTLYRDISTRVMQVLADEVGPCEIYSIDEAFFGVHNTFTETDAAALRDVLWQKVGVPVSVGIAETKTLAKVASEIEKKGCGYYVLDKADWVARAKETPTGTIWGLGRATTTKLTELGVKTAYDFMQLSRSVVRSEFGVGGERVYDELRGVRAFSLGENSEALRQSISSTRSFANETKKPADLESAIAGHVVAVCEKLRSQGLCVSRIYVQLLTNRHGDFFMQGGSSEITLTAPTNETAVVLSQALEAVTRMQKTGVPYKKAGIVAAGLLPEALATRSLFAADTEEYAPSVDVTIDAINARLGKGMVRPGVLLDKQIKTNAKLRSPNYTTMWKDIPTVVVK